MNPLRFLSVLTAVLSLFSLAAQAGIETTAREKAVDVGEFDSWTESDQMVHSSASSAQDSPLPQTNQPSAVAVSEEQESKHQNAVPPQPAVQPLTLEEAINLALEANRNILDARDGVESARLSIVSAESDFELKFFPVGEAGFTDGSDEDAEESFGAGVGIQKRLPVGTLVTLEPNVQKTAGTYQTRVDASLFQPLLRGLNREFNLSGVHGAEFGARSARRSLYLTRVSTVTSTVRAVYGVIRQRELMRVNDESVSRLKHHAEAARVKEKFGLATPIDVYRAEIELKRSEDNLTSAREAYEDAMDILKVILAFPLEGDIDVSAPLKYSIVHMDEKEATETALNNRVELKQAWDAVKEAERRSRVAKHSILPDLNVTLSLAPFGSSSDFGAELDEYTWGVSLSSSTDIRRTAERAAYGQSVLDVDAAYRNVSLLRDEVIRETKSALRTLREAEQRIEIQKEQIKNAEGKLRLAQVKFKHGMANNFDLIEAEEQLRQAETNIISVVIDYITGGYDLRAAMGTLLEQPAGL